MDIFPEKSFNFLKDKLVSHVGNLDTLIDTIMNMATSRDDDNDVIERLREASVEDDLVVSPENEVSLKYKVYYKILGIRSKYYCRARGPIQRSHPSQPHRQKTFYLQLQSRRQGINQSSIDLNTPPK